MLLVGHAKKAAAARKTALRRERDAIFFHTAGDVQKGCFEF
jgi:hypothetical protein